MTFEKTDTTRYLAAAAYRDFQFRDKIIEETVNQRYRAIAPCYGVDLVTVVKHCLKARRIKIIRNILIALTLLILFLKEDFYKDLVYVFGQNPEQLPQFIEYYFWSPIVPSLVLAFFIVGSEKFLTTHTIVAKSFSKNAFVSKSQDAKKETDNQHQDNSKLNRISTMNEANVVVYGAFSPFVGSGLDYGGWSFVVNISKAKEPLGKDAPPKPFDIVTFYDFIGEVINEMKIDGLTVNDKLFVDGRSIRDEKCFMPKMFSRPVCFLEDEKLTEFVGYTSDNIRHYKEIQVIGWNGEMITTIFLRLEKTKNHLFVEANYFLLPPLQSKFYNIDELSPKLSINRVLNILFTSAIYTPVLWIGSPFFILYYLTHPIGLWQQNRTIRKIIKNNMVFNHGATVSIRELASSSEFRVFFQKLDRDMHFKIIERQLLDLIVDFLDEHNIDTSDLKERQTTILNNGVIVSGGMIKAKSLAVGKGAKAAAGNTGTT